MIDLLGTGPHWNLGVHTAALGGAWQTVVQGFCQVDLREEGVSLRVWPRLPATWSQVSFGFFWHGCHVYLTADHQHVDLRAESGPVQVFYPGGQAELQAGQSIVLPYTD